MKKLDRINKAIRMLDINPIRERADKINYYRRLLSGISTDGLKAMAIKKGFKKEEVQDLNAIDLRWLLGKARYYTEKGYDIYGNK